MTTCVRLKNLAFGFCAFIVFCSPPLFAWTLGLCSAPLCDE
uniref:Uncharacterized protein n=1 Tax=Musa acuminata subsp. malaccensis TaxID=214687 RepID=A0A804HXE1_MUSAM